MLVSVKPGHLPIRKNLEPFPQLLDLMAHTSLRKFLGFFYYLMNRNLHIRTRSFRYRTGTFKENCV